MTLARHETQTVKKNKNPYYHASDPKPVGNRIRREKIREVQTEKTNGKYRPSIQTEKKDGEYRRNQYRRKIHTGNEKPELTSIWSM